MNTKINPEKLAQLDSIVIDDGSHYSFEEGHCAMEVVAWLADEGHTDTPECVSPVLVDYVRELNDQWGDDERQVLKPYLVRMIGTGGDGKEETRRKVVVRHIADIIGPWLRLAGLDAEADALAGLDAEADALDVYDRLAVAHKIQDARYAALAARKRNYQLIRGRVLGHLETEGISAPDIAVAAADAVADAVVDAAADAVAAADAALDAASAYSADRVVTIVSAAAGSVYAVDAVDAVDAVYAVGAVTAATDAYNAADAAGGNHWKMRNSAYNAARAYYAANPLPDPKDITDLAASQQGTALDLLDKMIGVDE